MSAINAVEKGAAAVEVAMLPAQVVAQHRVGGNRGLGGAIGERHG